MDDTLRKYLDNIRNIISEADIPFVRNPIDVLKQVISNPKSIKNFQKDFIKFDNPENFVKIILRVTNNREFEKIYNKFIRVIISNSLNLNDLESSFLSIAITLRNINNFKNKKDIIKMLKDVVIRYRKNPKSLLHLEPILADAKNIPESVRNLMGVALIQYIKNRTLK